MSDRTISEAAEPPVQRPPLLSVTVERYYRFDVERIMRDFGDEIRGDMERYDQDLDEVLRSTFDELCGAWADQDHIDGKYVWLEDSDSDMGWPDWRDIVARAQELLTTDDSAASSPDSSPDV